MLFVDQLGSTIVLVFEAPPDFVFTLDPHTKVRLGQPIGVLTSTGDADTADGADGVDDAAVATTSGIGSDVLAELARVDLLPVKGTVRRRVSSQCACV